MPARTMPPITSMVASNKPSLRAKLGLVEEVDSALRGSLTRPLQDPGRDFCLESRHEDGRPRFHFPAPGKATIFCQKSARLLLDKRMTSWEVAEKLGSGLARLPQRLKPHSKQSSYRSGKPLRHPKASATPSFSAAC